MAFVLPIGLPATRHGFEARACSRHPPGVPSNAFVISHLQQLSRQHSTQQLICHRRCLPVSHHGRQLSMAAATKGRLPQSGWVPQLPSQPLHPPDDSHAERPTQPQRRRPPLQRITTMPLAPQPPRPPPSTVQQPQAAIQTPQHAHESRPPPPGVPAAPRLQGGRPRRWPRLDYLIVVEGGNDAAAVTAATASQVFVLRGGAHAYDGDTIDSLRRAAFGGGRQLRGLIVFMDPDDTGRRGRWALDAAFPGQCWHAFIPAADATAQLATRHHRVGNLGVEHARPEAVQRALAAARLSDPERKEFDREDLVALGLVTEMGLAQAHTQHHMVLVQGQDGNNSMAPVMRELVGRLLGIGNCDGKQLVRQLNRFGFTHAELAAAVRMARGLLADRIREQREIRERVRQRQQGAPQQQ